MSVSLSSDRLIELENNINCSSYRSSYYLCGVLERVMAIYRVTGRAFCAAKERQK
jgi:hypothetical protein